MLPLLISLIVLNLQNTNGIVNIPLKPSYSNVINKLIQPQRNQILTSLKLLQINSKSPSFLQQIPLHKQIIKRKRLATYYGDIGVGIGLPGAPMKTQTFRMLFDTGSCEFWIPSDSCTTSRCLTHRRYSRSNTFKIHNGAALAITYLSGKVMGQMAEETIVLGDSLQVTGQVIGVADEVEIPLLDEVVWDGILGLAFPNNNLRKQGIKPLFDNLIEQKTLTSKGELNQFSYYLGNDIGAVSFGGAVDLYKRSPQEQFVWAPLTEEYYWTISLTNIRKEQPGQDAATGSKTASKVCPLGCKTIVDTGTYLIYGPQDIVNDVLGDVVIDNCEKKSQLPNIVIELKGVDDEYLELTLTPDDYVLQFNIDGKDDCVVGIAPDGEDNGFTLGQVFLKAFYTVFDRDSKRIGFVRSNDSLDEKAIEQALSVGAEKKFVSSASDQKITSKLALHGGSEVSVKGEVKPGFGNWKFLPFGVSNNKTLTNSFSPINFNANAISNLKPVFNTVAEYHPSANINIEKPLNALNSAHIAISKPVVAVASVKEGNSLEKSNSNGPIAWNGTIDDDPIIALRASYLTMEPEETSTPLPLLPSFSTDVEKSETVFKPQPKKLFNAEPAKAIAQSQSAPNLTDGAKFQDGPLPDSMLPTDDGLPMFKSKS